MERMKMAGLLLALTVAAGMAGCQRESPSGAEGEQPAGDTSGAPSGGAMGGSSGEGGAGTPPSDTP